MTAGATIDASASERIRLWKRTLDADPESLVTQSPEWMAALTSLGTWTDASCIVELRDTRLAVLPIAQRAGGLFKASPPHAWGFAGIVAEGGVTAADIADVLEAVRPEPCIRFGIRPNPLTADAWRSGVPADWEALPRLAHVIDLAAGADAVWARLDKDARRRVRRAERLGVEIECDTTGRLIPQFLELQRRSIERWARAQNEPIRLARWRARRRDSAAKFAAIAQQLGSRFRLWIASHQGQSVAANLVLQGVNAHATRAAMDRELAGPLSATALLEWRAIEHAIDAGCSRYHMGESGASARLAKYKRSFGAEAFPYAEYRRERIPLSRLDARARGAVKRVIGFRD